MLLCVFAAAGAFPLKRNDCAAALDFLCESAICAAVQGPLYPYRDDSHSTARLLDTLDRKVVLESARSTTGPHNAPIYAHRDRKVRVRRGSYAVADSKSRATQSP